MQTRLEKLTFSGREEDFPFFAEQFEARMILLKLGDVLNGSDGEESFSEEVSERQQLVWCELIMCLDRKSVLMLRSYKGDGKAAWKALCDRFKSLERPRIQKLLTKLLNLKMEANESVIDYLLRAEELQLNSSEAKEAVTEEMLISAVLRGLPREYDNLATIVKFGNQVKTFEILKRDLVNFASSLRSESKGPGGAFQSSLRQLKCHSCGRNVHKAKDCRSRNCFKCNSPGHIAKDCRINESSREGTVKTCYNCKKPRHFASQCRASSNGATKTSSSASFSSAITRARRENFQGFSFLVLSQGTARFSVSNC